MHLQVTTLIDVKGTLYGTAMTGGWVRKTSSVAQGEVVSFCGEIRTAV
jgi:hypothetical protein